MLAWIIAIEPLGYWLQPNILLGLGGRAGGASLELRTLSTVSSGAMP